MIRLACSIAFLAAATGLLLSGSARAEEPADPPYHLIYLHGAIIQNQQDARPEHPRFGFYELEQILERFREEGFEVTGEIRPREASVSDAADHVVDQVNGLLEAGVPADHIVVLGGSMGASIGLVVSARLQNPGLQFALVGTCLSRGTARLIAQGGKGPAGHVLVIRESSDKVVGDCPPLEADEDSLPLLDFRELLVDTGLDHGFLYRPIPEWVDPVLEWVRVTRDH